MARPLRLEFEGAVYHVTSRGDRREDIYESDADRYLFLMVLGDVCERYNWVCYGYCLMSNHYHLLIETPDANLSKGMRQLNGVYTQAFNRSNGKIGHLFQGRYKAILVEKQSYLLELTRYIDLNPVRARMVRSAKDWPWSSYRATTGQVETPLWLNTDWVLACFAKRKSTAAKVYRRFVSEGRNLPSPWDELKNQIFLGTDAYVEKLQSLIGGDKELSEIPASQKRSRPLPLSEYDRQSTSRNDAIKKAYNSRGYTLKAVGDYFGLHYSTVSGIVNDHKSKT